MIIVKTQQGTISEFVAIGQENGDSELIRGVIKGTDLEIDVALYATPERAAEVMAEIERHIENLHDLTIDFAIGNRIYKMPAD